MGLSRSLETGASSLKAHQQRMDVISNNLANTNTVGYKSNRANFGEQFNQVYNHGISPDATGNKGGGGVNPLQFGLGVKMTSIQQDMSQGVLETTNRPLDMALQGDGFFVYNVNGKDQYSRAAAISQDKTGNLVDTSTGAFLQGYNVETDANGRISKNSDGTNRLNANKSNLVITTETVSPPRQSQNISFYGNLNAGMATGDSRNTSINVYDNLGGVHSLSLSFSKTANPNEYALASSIDGQAVTGGAANITFNADGTLSTPNNLTFNPADINTALGGQLFDPAAAPLVVTLADPNNLMGGLTQFSGSNTASFKSQDGYTAGDLLNLTVARDGKIYGSFTNGQSEVVGQVVMAKFTNQDALVRSGDNFFSASPNSGAAIIGTANDSFPSSSIVGKALEQSNADMTEQFTKMISTQRAFEAASRTITISDTLLAEVNQLKR